MLNLRMMTWSSALKLILAGYFLIHFTGCAIGVTKVAVDHDKLAVIDDKNDGKILVKTFTDDRKDTQYIGNKRNVFGKVLGHIATIDAVKLETTLTKYFAEALEEAGYDTVIENPDAEVDMQKIHFDAVVEGKILEFWMDLYGACWHYMKVNVKALDKDARTVLWEKEIASEEKNVLWIGTTAEYERVIRESLTKSLNQAAAEFAADDFRDTFKE
jgi:hypothetical protein